MHPQSNYQTLGSYSTEKLVQSQKRRSKCIVVSVLLGLLLLIGGGVAAGIILHNRSQNQTSSSGSSGSSSNNGNALSKDDPSNFEKDSRLHRSFYGLAYTPEGSMLPDCGNSLENVIKDVQLMSQLTNKIRLYGSDCNQTALVLEAIKRTKVDMQVFLGNYVVATDTTPYTRQRDTIKNAIQTYGVDNIAGITVGNEFMLNYLTEHDAKDPNSDVGKQGSTILKSYVQDTKDMLAAMNLKKNIPIGNSDAGSFFSQEVLSIVDYGMSNVHAWFANTTASDAAAWVNNFFEETNLKPASELPNKPKMYIAETGWPTKSSDAGNANNGGSDASEASLQIFLDTFVCQANANGIGYFFFEFFDEKWKDIAFGGVEGWWGLFTADRVLKNIQIPNCPIS